MNSPLSYRQRVRVAPMMDWTDRHFRWFARRLTQHSFLYTEMVHAAAIIHGDRARHLDFSESEHPLALQLGGSHPGDLAGAVTISQAWAYDEINLNVGCPSERVQKGSFGACLMREPQLVAECISAMQSVSTVPITVKHRIGLNGVEDLDFLYHFIETVARAGCSTFIVHARQAILQGLSPKQNREIPPLRYELVYSLKQRYPELEIILNGGINNAEKAWAHLQEVDGIMIGREAYHRPYFLAELESQYLGTPLPSRQEVVADLCRYAEYCLAQGGQLRWITRHVLGLYQGQPGAKIWRTLLSDPEVVNQQDPYIFLRALEKIATI
jgi:tRNA-dihydrouridine synthase A